MGWKSRNMVVQRRESWRMAVKMAMQRQDESEK